MVVPNCLHGKRDTQETGSVFTISHHWCSIEWEILCYIDISFCALRLPSAVSNANANSDSLSSVAGDFSPSPLPTPTDFTNKSDGNETFLESGCSYLFEPTAKAGSAAGEGKTQIHSRDGADTHQPTTGLYLYH